MRIATWNIERFKHKNELDMIRKACDDAKADILVLTETDKRIAPDLPFVHSTTSLKGVEVPDRRKSEIVYAVYGDTENRVSIFTRYRCLKHHTTFDSHTAVAVELETELGNLIVYGTIMGILGNRNASFQTDLEKQMEDIQRLASGEQSICVIGDYNLSFGDNYCHTNLGRETVLKCFKDSGISILTCGKAECIDHIAITNAFWKDRNVTPAFEWIRDRKLSDHKGIVVQID